MFFQEEESFFEDDLEGDEEARAANKVKLPPEVKKMTSMHMRKLLAAAGVPDQQLNSSAQLYSRLVQL